MAFKTEKRIDTIEIEPLPDGYESGAYTEDAWKRAHDSYQRSLELAQRAYERSKFMYENENEKAEDEKND